MELAGIAKSYAKSYRYLCAAFGAKFDSCHKISAAPLFIWNSGLRVQGPQSVESNAKRRISLRVTGSL